MSGKVQRRGRPPYRAACEGATHCATLSLNVWSASLRAASSAEQQGGNTVMF